MSDNKTHTVKTVPDGYTAVTPWIISPSTEKMIHFLTVVFDAEEVPNSRITDEEGVIIHAVVKVGNTMVMLFDARDGWGPTPTFLNLYVEDIEIAYQKALALGATSVTNITTLWFGEKVCRIIDPLGNLLWINQRIEEVDFTNPEEVKKRASSPEAIAGIAYIQKSLDEAIRKQKRLLQVSY
ncbi:VOC family protein [Cytophagaceae bacterium YF14B1]|uniref:VOC family protein n=1 Tax=Xanthocytophaga flava TaxID=3048013 RepID=A0AAE3QQZ9_9BACT|nr:VOC family protein [Xanthocytophaga flavus]MDJ1481133.1 VOC family protein [Xanthocytophaga flavus]